MNTGIISVRYARALFAYTEHEGVSDEVFREMEILARHFALEPRLRPALVNPILGTRGKIALIKSAISERVTRQTWRFIRLVVRNQREFLLQSIAVNYLDLYRKARNINVALLETVVPLAQDTEERIKTLVRTRTGGEVELDKHINPELIGGFIFQMNFMRIDASIASQLTEIKKHFINEHR
ncbi:MAG: F0F1 ATP synthase subunit delta [Bacteroidales bacterium]|nr:F0F1 ATP synthase subunit delta [Bacteroidales bacterium]MCL2132739.1 F0F1 ATP synthase subunit delta [Bacteroidales bacterium]